MSRPKMIIHLSTKNEALAGRFYAYLQRLGYGQKSCRSRFNYIREFLGWCQKQGIEHVQSVRVTHIKAYYAYISSRPNLNKEGGSLNQKTTHGHMRNVRDLFTMLQKQGVIRVNPCSTLHFPYPQAYARRSILTRQQIKTLYEACQTAQERAILSMAYGCGLRASELTRCNIEDVRFRDRLLIVPDGKGKKRRVVPMSKGVVKDLADYYYKEREELTKKRDYEPGQKAFMLHSRGGRMQKWTYNKYLKRILKRTEDEGIISKCISLHSLRHSIATHLLEQGIGVEQVRQFLGHAMLETTQVYTHISKGQLQKLLS